MSLKLNRVIFTVSVFSLLTVVPVQAGDFSGFSDLKPSKILNIDKIRRSPILRPVFSEKMHEKAVNAVRVSIVYIEKSPVGDCYRNQPLLFGFLTLFSVVSLGALGFVFHLIRNDPRFY